MKKATPFLSLLLSSLIIAVTLLSCSAQDMVTSGQTTQPPTEGTESQKPDDEGGDLPPEDLPPVEGEREEFPFPWDDDNFGSYLYVSTSKGSDTNDATTPTSAVKTLERAYSLAESAEGESAVIVLTDNYTLSGHFNEPYHKKNLTVTSKDSSTDYSLSGAGISYTGAYRYILAGNTRFENLTITYKSSLNFVCNYNYISFGEGMKMINLTSGNGVYVVGGYQNPSSGVDLSRNSHIRIYSGDFYAVIGGSRQAGSGGELEFTGYHYIEINGGNIRTVYGGSTSNHTSRDSYITVNGGNINTVCAAGELTRSLSGDTHISLLGGKVDLLNVNNVFGDAMVELTGCELRAANVSYYDLIMKANAKKAGGRKIFLYPDGKFTEERVHTLSEHFDSALSTADYYSSSTESEHVMFVSANGLGDGSSADTPASLSKALTSLKSGGTVVITDKVPINTAITYSHSGTVVFTSKYGGVDYAKENGAALVFGANYRCGGETLFEHITIQSTSSYKSIYAQNNPLTIGKCVTCIVCADEANYMSVMGGSNVRYTNASSQLTINSGTWQRVRGGTAADGSTGYDVTLTVNGGRFIERLTLGSSLSHSGNINATVNGGIFYGGICASTLEKASHVFSSNTTLSINGGVFYSAITVASSDAGTYNGNFDVKINGGEFSHLVRLTGGEGLKGALSSTLDSKIDIDAVETGSYNFANPIQGDGADPWLFYNNGYYYYIATAGSVLRLRRAANIGDLPYAESKIIYDPEEGKPWSKNLWSPEIHFYTDEEIGEGNGGWYCYIACDNGDNKYHRMYVIKCLDGNDLFGRWGNPVTGEVNVPQKIEANDIPDFDNIWAAGQTDIKINGQYYMMYVTEACKGTTELHQTINIVKMTNPWTIIGESKVICRPDYAWEMHGHAISAETGKVWPKVVEGGTAVYGDDGSVFIVYSGSGYWTTYYALGQLKYMGGDPLDINNWEKTPEPIFSKNSQINGCGHASYVTDTSGQRWICYHAYTGKNTDSGRDAFVEPYTANASGVTVGNGSKHPADLATVYTSEVNPMSLRDKTSGFSSVADR